jgi:hypothetical protein
MDTLFFKAIGGGRQIGRVNDGHRFPRRIQIRQNRCQQLPVNLP